MLSGANFLQKMTRSELEIVTGKLTANAGYIAEILLSHNSVAVELKADLEAPLNLVLGKIREIPVRLATGIFRTQIAQAADSFAEILLDSRVFQLSLIRCESGYSFELYYKPSQILETLVINPVRTGQP